MISRHFVLILVLLLLNSYRYATTKRRPIYLPTYLSLSLITLLPPPLPSPVPLQAANQYFSKEAPLVSNSIITFHSMRDDFGYGPFGMGGGGGGGGHVLDASVGMDEKLADFCLGFDETPASQVGR